jgi:hypothetical protein
VGDPRAGAAEEHGARSLAHRVRKALGRLRRRFGSELYHVFARPVRPQDAEAAIPSGYTFRWATAEDILACDARHTELDARERELGAARLAAGHRCVVALDASTVVFSMWMNPRNLNVPGHVKLPLRGDQAFIYKAFTSPDHRGRGLYEAGMRFVLAELRREGRRELLGYAHVGKHVSRKGLARLEFEPVGTFRTVFAPGFRRTFVSREIERRVAGSSASPASR